MKIKQEHLETLKRAIDKTLQNNPNLISNYESGNFPRSEKVKDLQVRFNNDLVYLSGLTRFICDEIYSYANDTHLKTALNKICPAIVRRY